MPKNDVCPACGRAKPGRRNNPSRDRLVLRLHKAGKSYAEIASTAGISREAARQIVLRSDNG